MSDHQQRLAERRRRLFEVAAGRVTLAHGSGGKAMHELIEALLLPLLGAQGELARLDDQARLDLADTWPPGARLAFTTDGFVVQPPVFPGGDIGRLAVCGTVNDLAVGGAEPRALALALVLEEGLELALLERILQSAREAAAEAGIAIVTGDTKVVPRGACDGLFVTTSGIGVVPPGCDLGPHRIRPGDRLFVSGPLGQHGAAVLVARGEMALEVPVRSDCAPLADLVRHLRARVPGLRCLRDPTRGGFATTAVELARAAGLAFEIEEDALPVDEAVRGVCEILGLDPLYLACEGRLVGVVAEEDVARLEQALADHPQGAGGAVVGRVSQGRAGRVVMQTAFGGRRIVDMLVGDQLPRIC